MVVFLKIRKENPQKRGKGPSISMTGLFINNDSNNNNNNCTHISLSPLYILYGQGY